MNMMNLIPETSCAISSFPSPTVNPDLARFFRSQAAKAASLDNFQTLITKYQDDPDTTDDESVSSLRRNGLRSPPLSPKFKQPLTRAIESPPDKITTNKRMITVTSTSANPTTLAQKSSTSPHSKRSLRSKQQCMVGRRMTRSQTRPTTKFLALDHKGDAVITEYADSILSNLSRPAGVQRKRQTNGKKPFHND